MEEISKELRELKKLVDDGIITQEEFEAKKKQILNIPISKTKEKEEDSIEGKNIFGWYAGVWTRYGEFGGRSGLKEYWYFVLVNFLVGIGLGILDAILFSHSYYNTDIFSMIYGLFVFIPSLAVSVRRLHDSNKSGWWLFWSFLPVIGWIILLLALVENSSEGENDYGSSSEA